MELPEPWPNPNLDTLPKTKIHYTGPNVVCQKDKAILAAILTDKVTGNPLSGQLVRFLISGDLPLPLPAYRALTNQDGIAEIPIKVELPEGNYRITVSFIGDEETQGSLDVDTLTVESDTNCSKKMDCFEIEYIKVTDNKYVQDDKLRIEGSFQLSETSRPFCPIFDDVLVRLSDAVCPNKTIRIDALWKEPSPCDKMVDCPTGSWGFFDNPDQYCQQHCCCPPFECDGQISCCYGGSGWIYSDYPLNRYWKYSGEKGDVQFEIYLDFDDIEDAPGWTGRWWINVTGLDMSCYAVQGDGAKVRLEAGMNWGQETIYWTKKWKESEARLAEFWISGCSDGDHDCYPEPYDNCPSVYNPDQVDADDDNIGDVCDNCPTVYNPDQTDADGDNIGDACDNCLSVSNPDQVDSDGDDIGDICDNCVNVSNAAQIDSDGDGLGDLCDNCPLISNPDQADNDEDGLGDVCDPDDDNDGVVDEEEEMVLGMGDGTGDGVQDSLEANVAFLMTSDGADYMTGEFPAGTAFSKCKAIGESELSAAAPAEATFQHKFIEFTLNDVKTTSITGTIYLPDGMAANTYYKFGPTPDNKSNHWYEFIFDGKTGAEINGNTIILHFVDGKWGDDDLIRNGVIQDLGGAADVQKSVDDNSVSTKNEGDDSSGGSGGCFMSTIVTSSVW